MQRTAKDTAGPPPEDLPSVEADAVIVTVPLGVLRAGIGVHGPAVRAAVNNRQVFGWLGGVRG